VLHLQPLLFTSSHTCPCRFNHAFNSVAFLGLQCNAFILLPASPLDLKLQQAIGGGIAIVVGASLFNSAGVSAQTSSGSTSLQNSRIAVTRSRFHNCVAESFTGGASSSGALGPASVYGGALAILQSIQMYEFLEGLMTSTVSFDLSGFESTVTISNSNFSECRALTNSSSVRPGSVHGGGGALYASSVALSNVSVSESVFTNCSVYVVTSSTGVPSNSSGGALSIEFPSSSESAIAIFKCRFLNCSARGAGISNVAVRGGAVAVTRAAFVAVLSSQFFNCSIEDAVIGGNSNGIIVSGGSGICVTLARLTSIRTCRFDAASGRDSSHTSAGVLVLFNTSANSKAEVSDTSMRSPSVVFSVLCVRNDGFWSLNGPCEEPTVLMTNSNISQLRLPADVQFADTGSALMTIHSRAIFSRSIMQCALSSEFAVFKRPVFGNAFRDEYSCRPCPRFEYSLSASEVLLERLLNSPNVTGCVPAFKKTANQSSCPFGVASCTTFVSVTAGFWSNFSASGSLEAARRCPDGYCGCSKPSSGTCPLTSGLSIDRNPDPLCLRNRMGMLCGGCIANFTQSMDRRSCVSNEECSMNLWLIWTMSMLGYAVYALNIVVSCGRDGDTSVSCLLFFLQISSFASISSSGDSINDAIMEMSLLGSFVSFVAGACYASDVSAYKATAYELIGPLFVLVFSVLWTWILRALQPRLRLRSIQIEISYSGTLAAVILFVFSKVSSTVFTLVQCTSYDTSGVVFIDGTVPCLDSNWTGLVVVVVLLCLFPFAFFAALWLNKLPTDARAVVCRALTEPMFSWQAITLGFRLFVSVSQFLEVSHPNLLAFIRMLISLCVFFLLLNTRPYLFARTFWLDVLCYACLIAQFGLQTLFAEHYYLGVTLTEEQIEFSDSLRSLSLTFRWTKFPNCLVSSTSLAVACMRTCIAFHTSKCRYLPVALFAVAWVNTKIHTANESMPLSKRFGDIARMLRRRVSGEKTHLHESVEMRTDIDAGS
jgi:hypothetical protein